MRPVVLCCLISSSFVLALPQRSVAQAPFPEPPSSVHTRTGIDQYRNGAIKAAGQQFQWADATATPALPETAFSYEDQLAGYRYLAGIKANDSLLLLRAEEAWRTAVIPNVFRERMAAALSEAAFRKSDWQKTTQYGEAAGYYHHSNDELAAIKFQTAYAYLNLKELDKAEPLFRAMKGVAGPYQQPAYYYYGLLAYQQNRYDEALRNLRQVADEPRYKSTVPYFIAELKYLQGDKKGALKDAQQILESPDKNYYRQELQLLIAQVYYDAGDYQAALPYFESYYDAVDAVRRETLYETGYSYFKTSQYQQAIARLQPVTAGADSLAQLSAVLLGDAYLMAGDRTGARTAYILASGHDYFPELQQSAMLKAAALLYEAGRDNEALRILNQRSEQYPSAPEAAQAQHLLAAINLRAGQYTAALRALEGQQAAPRYAALMQRASYGSGLQQLQAGDVVSADSLLQTSLRFPEDVRYRAATAFWLSETAYRLGKQQDAIRYADLYLQASPALSRPVTGSEVSPAAAALTKGYAYLNLKEYQAAQAAFAVARSGNATIAANAAVREADAALMQKDFGRAQQLYQQAGVQPTEETDYTLLQQATLLGLQGKLSEKQVLLQKIMSRTQPSMYAAEARYESGLNLIAQDKYRDAIAMLTPLTSGTPFASKALLRIGYSQQELSADREAIAAYTQVVESAFGTPEATAALEALRSLYTEAGQPEAYAKLVAGMGQSGSPEVADVFYNTAETHFAANRFDKAAAAYSDYLNRFPEGTLAPKAAYYGAQSYDRIRNYPQARQLYEKVMAYPASEFSALAAQRAAILAEQASDTAAAQKAYETLLTTALDGNQQQHAQLGLLRIYNTQNKPAEVAVLADSLIANPSLDATTKTSVLLYRANAASALGDSAVALRYWGQSRSSKLPAVSSEATYHLAAAYLAAGDLPQAEATAMSAIRISGAPEWWNVKSYLILATVFEQQNDYFNARATVESIIKNAKNPALKQEAKAQLDRIVAAEKQQTPIKGK
ncbi:MAG: tetratricopeptide repeat protein [Sphingobacteriales bacterium]|nr:MAG: tetratricopeptide repeat protein [Sphingobacteriales bacterium]